MAEVVWSFTPTYKIEIELGKEEAEELVSLIGNLQSNTLYNLYDKLDDALKEIAEE